MGKFAVIKFVCDNTLAVVPKKWILLEKIKVDGKICEKMMSFWPPNNLDDRTRKEEMPDTRRWTKYDVKILIETDHYAKAKKYEKSAEVTSNPERDEDDENVDGEDEMEDDGDADDESNNFSEDRSVDMLIPLPTAPKFTKTDLQSTPKSNPPESAATLASKSSGNNARTAVAAESGQSLQLVADLQSTPKSNPPEGAATPALQSSGNNARNAIAAKSGHSLQLVADLQSTPKSNPPEGAATPASQSSGNNARTAVAAKSGQSLQLVAGFQLDVLAKLDKIIENQKDELTLLRQIASSSCSNSNEILEEIHTKIDTEAQFMDFNEKLSTDSEFRKKMLAVMLTVGGAKISDTVRNIMRKLATNKLWSNYSYKGRKGKHSLMDLPVSRLIIRACLKTYSRAKEDDVEEAIGEVLRNAPHRSGGSKYKGKAKDENTSAATFSESDA